MGGSPPPDAFSVVVFLHYIGAAYHSGPPALAPASLLTLRTYHQASPSLCACVDRCCLSRGAVFAPVRVDQAPANNKHIAGPGDRTVRDALSSVCPLSSGLAYHVAMPLRPVSTCTTRATRRRWTSDKCEVVHTLNRIQPELCRAFARTGAVR